MKFRLVSALRKDGKPVLFDGGRIGKAYQFIERRDMLVVRTAKYTSQTEAMKLIKMLQQALSVRVIVVDESVEILILESRVGTELRKVRLRILSLVAGLVALWFSLKAKFALLRLRS